MIFHCLQENLIYWNISKLAGSYNFWQKNVQLTLSNLPPLDPSLSSTNTLFPFPYSSVNCFIVQREVIRFQKSKKVKLPLFFLCSCSLKTPLCCTSDKSVEPINSLARHRAASPVCVLPQGSDFILCQESYITLNSVSPEPTEESAEKLLLTRE